MNHNRNVLMGMVLVVFMILAACGKSSDDSSAAMGSQSTQKAESPNTPTNTENSNDTTEAENIKTNEKVDAPKKEENVSTKTTASLKEDYLKKLNATKKEMDEMRNNPIDNTTFALKKVEGDLYDVWDGLLNEIYGVLKEQLPSEEMEQLRKEQREWIDYRDRTAKAASLKFEGGTMEQLEYVAVQNNLTEERCFELVEDYMK
ncbi:lysozyme inhibitor LprI family protein [Neobacillus niacini]|uniref:lysozyme inhibitor LprI family protein n=1 Tax=Neobacillus niacini TaxID=86668 RepID=UPI0021CB6085|nr:lysozyme inhibitor LprI family protein [Neobacillus niacini]MCM3763711.1 DUF1311 domain-containing protein [Neobacillus niacini]